VAKKRNEREKIFVKTKEATPLKNPVCYAGQPNRHQSRKVFRFSLRSSVQTNGSIQTRVS